jgi:hypothetical protein
MNRAKLDEKAVGDAIDSLNASAASPWSIEDD